MRSIRNIWIDRCDIQNSGELSVWTKDGCSRTAQAGVPRTEMLHTMDCHRSLLRDARAYAIGTHLLATGGSLWTFFDRSPSLFRRDNDDTTALLTRIGDNQPWRALITPPRTNAVNTNQVLLHARSRIAQLDHTFREVADSRLRGGLAPGVQRRVCEFVEAHLSESIGLESLAATAGLSMHDFARAFEQTVGVTPHSYVVRRRIERAKEMSSMSGIAAALSPRERSILDSSAKVSPTRKLRGYWALRRRQ